MLPVALGIHAMPEPAVAIDAHLAIAGETHQWFPLQYAAFLFRKIREKISLEEEKSAIDLVILDLRFLRKFRHHITVQPHLAKA